MKKLKPVESLAIFFGYLNIPVNCYVYKKNRVF